MPLQRKEVVDGALDLLDRIGLEALTMRRVAGELGVRAGAIYWHFKDKQDLEDAMVDEMFSAVLPMANEGTWQEQISELSRRMAAAMLARRDGAMLTARALRPGPHGLAVSERMLAILHEAGRGKRATLWAAAVLGYFVVGYATDVQATEAAKARGVVSIARALTKKLDKKEFPRLKELDDRTIRNLMTARDARGRFEFGLRVVLAGLEATPVKATRTRTRRRTRKAAPR
jgi:TetR/AcrR family tetracycline transcriptional repressor